LKTLPSTIGDLHYLDRLSVYGNNLETLPRSFSNLQRLKILRLGGNKLVYRSLAVIRHMYGLEQLYLRENNELTAIPYEVLLLKNLSVLDARYCEKLQYPPLQVVDEGIERVKAYARRFRYMF
jgi:Leucine-rich repeat (LRR) protein